MNGSPSSAATLHLTRRFAAPRERVFEALTDPEQIQHWFGTPGSSVSGVEVDLREGGTYRFAMERAGMNAALVGRFLEVEPPKQLVYTFSWDPPLFDMMDIGETRVTVRFTDIDGETEVVLVHERLRDEPTVQSFHEFGWNASMDQLGELLSRTQAGPR